MTPIFDIVRHDRDRHSPFPRPPLLGAAALSLLLGYLDLWRGGETIAPLLLVLGYVVLIPLAILKG